MHFHSFNVWTTVQIILTKYKLIKMSTINLNSMKKWAGPIKHLGIDEKSPRLIGPILLHFDILIVRTPMNNAHKTCLGAL